MKCTLCVHTSTHMYLMCEHEHMHVHMLPVCEHDHMHMLVNSSDYIQTSV